MKRTTVTTLVANLCRAAARRLDRAFAGATRTDSRSRGTSRIGELTSTGALCPDVTGGWSLAVLLIGSFLAVTSLPAAEQDNWYLANEWEVSGAAGVAYEVNASTGRGRIYVARAHSSGAINVYETNGTLLREISGLHYPRDVTVDGNGTIYVGENNRVSAYDQDGNVLWRLGKNANSGNGSPGSGDGEFNQVYGIAISPAGELFVADKNNYRIQVLDRNGTYKRKFGSNGTAPGQLQQPVDLAFLPDGKLAVSEYKTHLHSFKQDGTFLERHAIGGNHNYNPVSAATDGTLLFRNTLRESTSTDLLGSVPVNHQARTAFTPAGDLIESSGNIIKIWKRAYRTKGLANRNVIPQPAIRGIAQRAGTNVIDLDFEIIDPDDNNATVGILAAVEGDFDDTSKWILPTVWVDGTESKIGVPLATNQVHRVSWNVKGDWNSSTGTLKFEVLCRDARRVAHPVDLHFLELPIADGNLTISRSPLTDSDFETHFKYLLATGQAILDGNTTKTINATEVESNATHPYVFTNAGSNSFVGPTWAEVNASYMGSNLEGNVSISTQGIQEWTVPASGTYTIEAWGARGGVPQTVNDSYRGSGAIMKGDFSLVQGQVLKIVVGQEGTRNTGGGSSALGGRGGGGSFVWINGENQPLIVAGGGGGASITNNGSAIYHKGKGADIGINGQPSWNNESNFGVNGGDATYTGGAKGWKSMLAANDFTGDNGGGGGGRGGFGGGGRGADGSPHAGGGGGGYSGGGGGRYGTNTGSGNSGRNGGGGGGTYNTGSNQESLAGYNDGHGKVLIAFGSKVKFAPPSLVLMKSDRSSTGLGRYYLMKKLGHRYATTAEVTKAREAATPGSVNKWTANRPVLPRNLPGKVNEFGFDTGSNIGFWVIEQQQ